MTMFPNTARTAAALLLAICAVGTAAARENLPVEQFFKRDAFDKLLLSPNGDYLAATTPQEDRTGLVILRRADMHVTARVTPEAKAHISDFAWVNPERVLFTAEKSEGAIAAPMQMPGLYGLNVDGSGPDRITDNYIAVLDTLRDSPDMVQVELWERFGYALSYQMDVTRGNPHGKRIESPIGEANFITDNSGAVRFAIGRRDDQDTSRLYIRNDSSPEWEMINEEKATGSYVTVLGFSADNRTAYLSVGETGGPDGVYAFDMQTRQRKLVSRDDNVDPYDVLTSPVDGGVYAVRYLDGRPRTEFVDKSNPFALDLKKMQAAFPDADVVPASFTHDGKLGIYFVWSDTNPGDYYLLDRDTGKANYIASRASWIDPGAMAKMTPFSFKARDGLELEGFLTTPVGSEGKHLPLVVMPHGGPFQVFDSWGFNPEVQLLANRGYAVLQLNYRGSDNYGQAFEAAGYRQWGKKMQDDLTDATHWAIDQGVADPRRICIYGASYGAYAALMGVAREPNLYRCAIGNVGVYDLADAVADDSWDYATGNFFKRTMGDSDLHAISPNRLAGSIKVPVLLAAGNQDTTAPPDQTKRMRDALQNAGVPVDAVFYPHEGHGNYLIANQVDWANRVLAFLDKNIGAGATGKP